MFSVLSNASMKIICLLQKTKENTDMQKLKELIAKMLVSSKDFETDVEEANLFRDRKSVV